MMKRFAKKACVLALACAMLLCLAPGALADVSASLVLRGWDGDSYQYILFGSYDSESSLPEPILWRVLHTTQDRALLVSEYILEARPFDEESSQWAGSEIKEWLNTTFLNEAFSSREAYEALGDSSELGRVFLLSRADWLNESYGFSQDASFPDDRRIAMGAYGAIDSGLWQSSTGYSSYYTRTDRSGASLYQIRSNGTLGEARIDRDNVGIRPAISIHLDKVSFSAGDGSLESPYR